METLKSTGTDDMLKHDIEKWVNKYNEPNTNNVTTAILAAVIYVANELLVQKAVSLPWACHVFWESYNDHHAYIDSIKSVKLILEFDESVVTFSSRWLLDQLIVYLNCYMLYKRVHMKFGIMLYRKGIDPLVSLSWALSAITYPKANNHDTKAATNTPEDKIVLHEAGYVVNDLIHNEIEKQSLNKKSDDLSVFNIDTQLQSVNPLLLEFMTSITASVRKRKHNSTKESDHNKHMRKIRIYFALCLLQYCTNPSQPIPFHILISDVVEVCGGSRMLLKILNRVGCTSSPDTHDCFVTYHAEATRKCHTWNELLTDIFTVASVDNFDMLQSYSSVYCGDQQRSYHGTTVQLVQPNSKLLLHNNIHMADTAASNVATKVVYDAFHNQLGKKLDHTTHLTNESTQNKTSSSKALQVQCVRELSPDSSQHKLGKVGPKRKRTVAVKNLSSLLKVTPTTSDTAQPQAQNLILADFEATDNELENQKTLKRKLFPYSLQKCILHYHEDLHFNMQGYILSDIRQFLNSENQGEMTQPLYGAS